MMHRKRRRTHKNRSNAGIKGTPKASKMSRNECEAAFFWFNGGISNFVASLLQHFY